jgi:hypothetical protein
MLMSVVGMLMIWMHYFRYLGHMYMAESLVALDRIADSIDHLNADLITDVSTVFPVDVKQEQGWCS